MCSLCGALTFCCGGLCVFLRACVHGVFSVFILFFVYLFFCVRELVRAFFPLGCVAFVCEANAVAFGPVGGFLRVTAVSNMAATRDIEGVWFREDAGKGGPSQPLRIGAPKAESDTVVVSFDGRTAHMSLCRDAKASVDVSSCTGVVLNWGHLGHSDWGQAHFLFDGSNAQVLIEKGHHIWRKSPPSFLSFEQLKTFRKNGYLVLRGAVCKDLVQRARRAILADMQVTFIATGTCLLTFVRHSVCHLV